MSARRTNRRRGVTLDLPHAVVRTMTSLLAVDLGLRAGFALYKRDRGLLAYRSQAYGTVGRLKRAAFLELAALSDLEVLVLEGDANLARVWARLAERRGVRMLWTQAHEWRRALLLDRERRSGRRAKEAAGILARRIIAASPAPNAMSLRHDAAEAILLGWWGCTRVGWIDTPPPRS